MGTDEPDETIDAAQKKQPELRVVDRRWWARGESAPNEDVGERKPSYVEDLERQLKEALSSLQAANADRRRALEEFEQAKVRIRREVGKEAERSRRAILVELLEVLDNLDRAIEAARRPESSSDEAQALVRGVTLVRDQFRAKLETFGVTILPSGGLPFDASRHEAVSIVPVADPSQEGIVLGVIKEGYAIGDDLLRPASVVVGRRG
jgi:molecular chaperone GrpE